jgi:hypothetical protein
MNVICSFLLVRLVESVIRHVENRSYRRWRSRETGSGRPRRWSSVVFISSFVYFDTGLLEDIGKDNKELDKAAELLDTTCNTSKDPKVLRKLQVLRKELQTNLCILEAQTLQADSTGQVTLGMKDIWNIPLPPLETRVSSVEKGSLQSRSSGRSWVLTYGWYLLLLSRENNQWCNRYSSHSQCAATWEYEWGWSASLLPPIHRRAFLTFL